MDVLFGKEPWRILRKLRWTSETARYLKHATGREDRFLQVTSNSFFQEREVRGFMDNLLELKNDFRVEIAEIIYELNLPSSALNGNSRREIIDYMLDSSSMEGFLAHGKDDLETILPEEQIAVLENLLRSNGHPFAG